MLVKLLTNLLEKRVRATVIAAEKKADNSRRVFVSARDAMQGDVKNLELKRVEIASQLTKLTDVQTTLATRQSLTSKRIDKIDKMLEEDVD